MPCTDCTVRNKFYDDLNRLLNMEKSWGIVVVVRDLIPQLSKLTTAKMDPGDSFALGSQRTDRGDRKSQFLPNINFL